MQGLEKLKVSLIFAPIRSPTHRTHLKSVRTLSHSVIYNGNIPRIPARTTSIHLHTRKLDAMLEWGGGSGDHSMGGGEGEGGGLQGGRMKGGGGVQVKP